MPPASAASTVGPDLEYREFSPWCDLKRKNILRDALRSMARHDGEPWCCAHILLPEGTIRAMWDGLNAGFFFS